MSERFFNDPILNSPYECPTQHWQLLDGIPTEAAVAGRRESRLITPIPQPKKRGGKGEQVQQRSLAIGAEELSDEKQQYEVTQQIDSIRILVEEWRQAPESQWKVTPETARLLKHWRHHEFQGIRPFWCQIEAAETAIWLTEVAPELGKRGKYILEKLESANEEANAEANSELFRLALKLATGAGKTTVMAMLIAWQTINAARHPGSSRFTKGFLVVAPGLTIRDQLRVLQPNDSESYFTRMELVPQVLRPELGKARIVITNYLSEWHPAFLQLAATLEGCARRYAHYCRHYRPRAKPASKSCWGSRLLQRDGGSGGKGGSRKGVAAGQLLLPWGGGGVDLPLPEEWQRLAETFRRANGARASSWD